MNSLKRLYLALQRSYFAGKALTGLLSNPDYTGTQPEELIVESLAYAALMVEFPKKEVK